MIFFCDALSQVVSSDFSAARNLLGGSQDWKGGFVSLRSVVGQLTSEALFVPATPSFSPSISVSASVGLSASMLRGICDGGILVCG